jgi:hypothetical protein
MGGRKRGVGAMGIGRGATSHMNLRLVLYRGVVQEMMQEMMHMLPMVQATTRLKIQDT